MRTVAPNLTALLGADVCLKLIKKTGGLGRLTQLNDNALRHLGCDEFHEPAQAAQMKLLCAGYLTETELFTSMFDTSQAQNVNTARKALAILARKALLVAKKDYMNSNNSSDINSLHNRTVNFDNMSKQDSNTFTGEVGKEEAAKLRSQFERLLKEGKVQVNDEQALPVPEIHRRGEDLVKRRRGGQQEFKKRQRQGVNDTSTIEKILSRVKMGVSEDEQRQELLQQNEIRVKIMKEQTMHFHQEFSQNNLVTSREINKNVNLNSNNTEVASSNYNSKITTSNNNEYDDLMTLTFETFKKRNA